MFQICNFHVRDVLYILSFFQNFVFKRFYVSVMNVSYESMLLKICIVNMFIQTIIKHKSSGKIIFLKGIKAAEKNKLNGLVVNYLNIVTLIN